jgi:hypothetical protein
VTQTRGELRYDVRGGTAAHLRWRARVRWGLMDNRDNGEGWYDYRRQHAQTSLTLSRGRWQVETTAGWRRYVYRVQYAGFGIDPPRLWRAEWNALVRIEREWREGLHAFLEAEHEHGGSNDAFSRFRATTAWIGLQLSR